MNKYTSVGQKLANAGVLICVFGLIAGGIIGWATRTVDPAYLQDYIKFPNIYPLSEAPYEYNFANAVIVGASSFLAGIMIYASGIIIEAQGHILLKLTGEPAEKE